MNRHPLISMGIICLLIGIAAPCVAPPCRAATNETAPAAAESLPPSETPFDNQTLLRQATDEYQSALNTTDQGERLRRFARAEALYAQLLRGDEATGRRAAFNPDLFVNMGNAALQTERLGPAVYAYREALKWDPNHRRAEQNLAHARSLLPEWVRQTHEPSLLDDFLAWGRLFSLGERFLAAAVVFLTAALLAAAAVHFRRLWLRNLAVAAGVFWIILLGWTWLGVLSAGDNEAVVIVPEVTARSADSISAPACFSKEIPGGTEVTILSRRDGWTHIRLPNGRDGWVNASSLKEI